MTTHVETAAAELVLLGLLKRMATISQDIASGVESTLAFLMALLDMRQSDPPFEGRSGRRPTALGASASGVAS